MFLQRQKSPCRLILTVLAVLFPLTTPTASANTLHVYNAALTPGQESIVEMRIVPTPDIAGVQVSLVYDASVMEAVDPVLSGRTGFETQGTLIAGKGNLFVNYEPDLPEENGQKGVILAWADVAGFKAAGLFARLIFRAKATLPPNAQTSLTLDPGPEAFFLSNGRGDTVPANILFHDPTDAFAPGIPGDINRDGKVSIADAILALNMAVGLGSDPTPEGVAAGDVADGDGVVTIRDVTKILQIVVGLA